VHGSMSHGPNRSTNLDGSRRGSWVSTRDPLTHDPLTDAIKFHEQFQWL